jgi:type II secretory pathway component PulK
MRYRPKNGASTARRGVVLLAVLVVVVMLTLAAYQFSEMMMAEQKAADSARRAAQARAFADSGLHYAAALLSNPDTFTNTLNSNPFENPQYFNGILVQDSDQPRARGRFSVVARLSPDETAGAQPYHFGVIDETGKINLNALMKLDSSGKVAHDILIQLPNMTEDIVNSILDWLDPDSDPRSSGAEEEYYSTLSPPYHCKNGPLDSLEELLLVKGVTPQLLYGNDRNRNGVLDPDEDDGSGTVDLGWAAYLTVFSRELNVDSQGNPRININDSDVNSLQQKLNAALDPGLANYIMAYRVYGPASSQQGGAGAGSGAAGAARSAAPAASMPTTGRGATGAAAASTVRTPTTGAAGAATTGGAGRTGAAGGLGAAGGAGRPGGGGGRLTAGSVDLRQGGSRRIGSLYELINSSVSIPGTNGGQATTYPSPLNDAGSLKELLPQLLDMCTTTTDSELPARVNVNTAPQAVLLALPGMDAGTVQTLLDHRPSLSSTDPPDTIFQTPAWLITEANLTSSQLTTLEKYITTRSQVYRVQVLGYFDSGGPTVRLEGVIDTNSGRPRLITWRDLTELGKGFDLAPSN